MSLHDEINDCEYIGGARYKPIRAGLFWTITIGDGQQTVGRFLTKTGAERMASSLCTAFLDGAFVSSERQKTVRELGQLMCEARKARTPIPYA